MKTIDLQQIRSAIENAPDGGDAAVVTRKWLQSVERELQAGRAAAARLSAMLSAIEGCGR